MKLLENGKKREKCCLQNNLKLRFLLDGVIVVEDKLAEWGKLSDGNKNLKELWFINGQDEAILDDILKRER